MTLLFLCHVLHSCILLILCVFFSLYHIFFFFFFFSSRRRHTRCYRDWSSDVCSSDLDPYRRGGTPRPIGIGPPGRAHGCEVDSPQETRRASPNAPARPLRP